MTIVEIRVNCPDPETAHAIAERLIGRRLAAAANVADGLSSVYRWKEEVVRAAETSLTVKTRAELFDAVAACVREAHPYETPSVLAFVVDRATEDYRAWVAAETRLEA